MSIQLVKERQNMRSQDASCMYEGAQVDCLVVESAADHVEIRPDGSRDIRIELLDRQDRPIRDDRQLLTERNGQTLRIYVQYPRTLMPRFKACIIRVHLPAYSDVQVHVSSASGAVHVRGVCLQQLSLSAASGAIAAVDCQARGATEVRTASGQVCLQEVEADSIKIGTASGAIETKKLLCTSLHTRTASGACRLRVHGAASVQCKTKSGAIELSGETRQLTMSTASGRLQAALSDLETASINTTSGCVDLELLDPVKCRNLSVQTASGSVQIILPHSICPAPSFASTSGRMRFSASKFSRAGIIVPLDVKTISGSVAVRPS